MSQDQEYEVSSSGRSWEEASGLKVVNGSHPRLDSLTSGLAGLKWNHSRVPWGTLQQERDPSGYKEQTLRSLQGRFLPSSQLRLPFPFGERKMPVSSLFPAFELLP